MLSMPSYDMVCDVYSALLDGGGAKAGGTGGRAVQVDSIKTHVESAYGFRA